MFIGLWSMSLVVWAQFSNFRWLYITLYLFWWFLILWYLAHSFGVLVSLVSQVKEMAVTLLSTLDIFATSSFTWYWAEWLYIVFPYMKSFFYPLCALVYHDSMLTLVGLGMIHDLPQPPAQTDPTPLSLSLSRSGLRWLETWGIT